MKTCIEIEVARIKLGRVSRRNAPVKAKRLLSSLESQGVLIRYDMVRIINIGESVKAGQARGEVAEREAVLILKRCYEDH